MNTVESRTKRKCKISIQAMRRLVVKEGRSLLQSSELKVKVRRGESESCVFDSIWGGGQGGNDRFIAE